ncbi:MAG: ATP-binding protein [Deltaproteobacteria bacterium]|nr:ATP-binding protein [Deltaproteobacteria bacterium]
MKHPTSIAEIQNLIDDEIQESLHLDYKDSRALTKKNKDEIIKDVTAFANADGGVIIYGVQEKGYLPVTIDSGVDNSEINREWIDQIISTNTTPPIEGVQILQIPLNKENSVYVILVPKTYRGPHQATDKRYYKRYNFRSCPMDHYEIFDIARRRSKAPRLVSVDVETKGQLFQVVIKNISDLPAHDLSFKFPEGFKWPRGNDFPNAFKDGIKYFPPGRKLSFFYSVGHAVFDKKENIPSEFSIYVSYFHSELGEKTGEDFNINFNEFFGAAIENDTAAELVSAIKSLNHQMGSMARNR